MTLMVTVLLFSLESAVEFSAYQVGDRRYDVSRLLHFLRLILSSRPCQRALSIISHLSSSLKTYLRSFEGFAFLIFLIRKPHCNAKIEIQVVLVSF